jgi:hypothetical protein
MVFHLHLGPFAHKMIAAIVIRLVALEVAAAASAAKPVASGDRHQERSQVSGE